MPWGIRPPKLPPQSHPSHSKGPLGQPYGVKEKVQVHRAEPKYPTVQLALPMDQAQELFYLYAVQKQIFILTLVDNEELSVFHALYKKAQKWMLLF